MDDPAFHEQPIGLLRPSRMDCTSVAQNGTTGIDAVFGAGTEEGVRDFQKEAGIVVDGIAGPETFEKLTV